MEMIYGFLTTILNFLVQIVMLIIGMCIYILQFIGDLIQGAARSV